MQSHIRSGGDRMRSVVAKEPATFTMIPVQRNGTCGQQLLIDEH
jgi:hypothetical protein